MKWNLMIGSFAVAMLSTNVLAMDIQHGKLLSHKEWSDANITGYSSDVSMDNAVIKSLQLIQEKSKKNLLGQNKAHDAIFVESQVVPVTVTPGMNLLHGFKAVYIENFTSSTHTYTLKTKMCVFPRNTQENEQCLTTQDIVSLNPNEYIDSVKGLSVSYDFPGTSDAYTLYIATTATRDDAETIFAGSSRAEIEVSKK